MRYPHKREPWAFGVDVKDCTTSREVMEKAHLNWTVDKCELVARMPFHIGGNNIITDIDRLNGEFSYEGNMYRTCPNAFGTYRTDTNQPLGLVKSKYEVVQNLDAFSFFDDAIGKDKAIWQYAGCLGFGELVYVAAKLPITTTVAGEPIENYLVFNNSHDGSKSLTIMFAPVRVFCTNMLNAGLDSSSSYIRIRHTESAKEKLQRGAEVLRIACENAKTAEQLYKALYSVQMNDKEVLAYLSSLVLTPAEYQKALEYDGLDTFKKLINHNALAREFVGTSTRKENRIEELYKYYQEGVAQESIKGTAWGAYNAVTGYFCNGTKKEGQDRFTDVLFDNGQSVMQKGIVAAYEIAKAA